MEALKANLVQICPPDITLATTVDVKIRFIMDYIYRTVQVFIQNDGKKNIYFVGLLNPQ